MNELKKIYYHDIKHLKSQVEKESVDLKDNWTLYVWLFIDWNLAWFCWFMLVWKNMRYKSDYILPEYRWRWLYRILFDARENICKNYDCSAFCTSKSIWTFKRYWFIIKSKKASWIYFVSREKNEWNEKL